ncbi:Cytochrome b561 domain-containing protein [Aphelenchoides besseyi]|nr:Cytochrome b561 domain-containing protein [Aphelenchoides besseyi]KAI6211005.1 Cytochrome b561 domain-containing protein [Aphelenchoides besseyi]
MTPALVYRTAHVFGLVAILVVILWMQNDAKGFDYHTEPKLEFKFHPILMSAGMLFLNGEAVMSFRALKAYPRYLVKALHASLHAAVRDAFQFDSTAVNRQSVHAWIGTILSSIYAFLWVASMFLFYFPLTPGHVRATALPYHRLSGIFGFSLAAINVALGVLERLKWGNDCNSTAVCTEDWLVKLFGVCVAVYVSCVLIIILRPGWSTKILAKKPLIKERKEQ